MNINEACMKECRIIPNVVKSTYDVRLSNTESLTVMPSKCSANTCMHWRWFDTEIKNEGYCGLAGKEGAE